MQVFLMHIPKTGVGTIEKAWEHAFDPDKIAPRYSYTESKGMIGVNFRVYQLVVGHYPYTFADQLTDPALVTMMRDPVARVLSHYAYDHQYGYHIQPEYTRFVKQASLRQWLDSPYSERRANNLMTRFFNDRVHDNLGKAIQHLKQFDWIGFLEDPHALQETSDDFLRYIDRHTVPVEGRYNATDHPVLLSELNPAMLSELQERNQKDLELYHAAREHMAERMKVLA